MQSPLSPQTWRLGAAACVAGTFPLLLWLGLQPGCGNEAPLEPIPSSPDGAVGSDGTSEPTPWIDGGDRRVDWDITYSDIFHDDGATTVDGGWATDPAGWTKVTDEMEWFEPCELFLADMSKLQIPSLDWQPCGVGCEVADITAGHFAYAYNTSRAETYDGKPYAQIWTTLAGPVARRVGRLVDLDSGEVLSAVAVNDPGAGGYALCIGGAAVHSPLVPGVTGPSLTQTVLYWDRQPRTWTIIAPPVADPMGAVSVLDALPGLAYAPVGGGLFVSMALRPASFQQVFAGARGPIPARGDQILFPDWRGLGPGSHGKLASWTPSTGAQTLLEPDEDPFAVGLSDTHLVWVTIPELWDPYAPASPNNVARFYWSPRARMASELQVHNGPAIPHSPPAPSTIVKTHGDWAAVASWTKPEGKTLEQIHEEARSAVTRFSTGDLWMIRARSPDHTPADVWAITDTHVYVAEGPIASTFPAVVVRYSLDHLDTAEQQ